MKYPYLLSIIALLIIGFSSCSDNDDDDRIKPSVSLVNLEGEGGEVDINLNNGDWYIEEVINRNGNLNVWGDVISSEGEIVKSNEMLKLEGLGTLRATWNDKGFQIIRKSADILTLIVAENSTGSDFNFVIVLRSGDETKDIEVMQKKSQGYKFDKIEYFTQENDGDSIYNKIGTTYVLDILEPQEYLVFPFKGVDSDVLSFFKSSDNNAFVWIADGSLKVEVPYHIFSDGKVLLGGERRLYSRTLVRQEYSFIDQVELVPVLSGKNEFAVEVEFRKRTVSYKLTLTNIRTGDKKEVFGKWIETSPTGKYSLTRK